MELDTCPKDTFANHYYTIFFHFQYYEPISTWKLYRQFLGTKTTQHTNPQWAKIRKK